MEFFFARTVKPWNTIPSNVRSINCNDKEIPHLRSWMIKHYNQQTESYFDVNNLCTWVSFCRCPSCRPVWVQSNNIVSLLPFLLTFHISYPIIFLFYLPSCVKLWIFFTSFLYSISLTSSYYFLGDVGSSCDMPKEGAQYSCHSNWCPFRSIGYYIVALGCMLNCMLMFCYIVILLIKPNK